MKRCILCFLLLVSFRGMAQLNADFSAPGTQGCAPFTVQFQDKSTGSPAEWFWDFGNGETSSAQNPSVTYITSGSYTVRLIVRNTSGQDYETKTGFIKVGITPATGFIRDVDSGCAPLQVSFTDTTKAAGTSIKSWLWNFGDGTTSTQQNPAHTFGDGAFTISLTTTAADGCTSTRTINSGVKAGSKPAAAFSASPLTGCASADRNFQNKTPGTTTGSLWFFGDGNTSGLKNPAHHYQDTGWFSVRLVASQRGCKDTTEMNNYIHVAGPVAVLRTVFNCNDRFTISLRDYSIGATSRLWDFGDGNTSTTANPAHTYSAKGMYIVKLIASGTTCSDTAYDTIYINRASPQIEVSPIKSSYCKGDTLQLSVKNYDTDAIKYFAWNFGDVSPTPFRSTYLTIKHVYNKDSIYMPEAYLYNYSGCRDTISIASPITIQGPMAQFQVAPASCTNTSVKFTDQSVGNPAGSIRQWLWSYGDGATANTQGPLQYAYIFPGIYTAQLTVTDANGCSDTISHAINIAQTPVVDAGNDTFVCARSKITLNASGADSYAWQTNSGLSCTNCANPNVRPNQNTTYYVTGTSNGCSASDSVNVLVQTKQQVSVKPRQAKICEGDSVALTASGAYNYIWTPSNTLSDSIAANPFAFPSGNTTYAVIGKDSANCFSDTAYANISVNPKPIVNIADSLVQVFAGSNFIINATVGSDVQKFAWAPKSGLSCYNCLQPVASISKNITYTLTATNNIGCKNSDDISIIAICNGVSVFMPNTFSPNNDGTNDYFYPRAAGNINIKSFTIFNRWGQMVFRKQNISPNNYKDGWNGMFNNVYQTPDVYVYVMELKCSDNKVFVKKGNVTLLR